MFKNYLLVAYRNFIKHPRVTFLNLVSLISGVSASLIVFVLVSHELSYDNYHQQADQIYRVNYSISEPEGIEFYHVTPNALADALSSEVPGISQVTQLRLSYGEGILKVGNEYFSQNGVVFAEPEYFKIFDYQILEGTIDRRMADPGTVIISESVATKLFGENSALGKTIEFNDQFTLEIVGVVNDPPSNSHLSFMVFISMETLERTFNEWQFSDGNVTYIVKNVESGKDDIERDINQLKQNYQEESYARNSTLILQPLRDIHLNTQFGAYPGSFSIDTSYLWGLTAIGLLILFSASFNYLNLIITQSAVRLKEIGIRKTLGGNRFQLTLQLVTETYCTIMISGLLSWIAAIWILPTLNSLFQLQLSMEILYSTETILFLLALPILISLIAGIQHRNLANYRPIIALRGTTEDHILKKANPKSLFVLFQLIVSHSLFIGVVIIFNQMNYIKSKPLGFSSDNQIMVHIPDDPTRREVFKNELVGNSRIEDVTYSMGGPIKGGTLNSEVVFGSGDQRKQFNVRTIPIDASYLNVFDIPLIEGQNLSPRHEVEPMSRVVLVNRSMVKELGFTQEQDIIGSTLELNESKVEIIGVVEDFHQKSLHNKLTPAVLVYWPRWTHYAGIKMASDDWQNSLSFIESKYKEYYTESYFSFTFLNDYIASLYLRENRIFNFFKMFTIVAIVIACLGLFAQVSLSTLKRTKEIGIRKVHGASISSLLSILMKNTVRSSVVSFLISAPFTIYFMQMWLEGFAYRKEIGLATIIIAGLISSAIAWLTVSYQVFKSAKANPIECLRSE